MGAYGEGFASPQSKHATARPQAQLRAGWAPHPGTCAPSDCPTTSACSGCCMKTPPVAFRGPRRQAEAPGGGKPGHLKRKRAGHIQMRRPHTNTPATHKCAGHTNAQATHTHPNCQPPFSHVPRHADLAHTSPLIPTWAAYHHSCQLAVAQQPLPRTERKLWLNHTPSLEQQSTRLCFQNTLQRLHAMMFV